MGVKINNKKLILVEGRSDVSFFEALLKNRGVNGFDVYCPSNMDSSLGGEDAILNMLKALPLDKNFSNLEKILIVVDSDSDASAKFLKFKTLIAGLPEISGTKNKYPVPQNPSEFAGAVDSLQIGVTLLPSTHATGAMESLCWDVAVAKYPDLITCVESFATCSNVGGWSPQKLAKFKLRSIISALHDKNPDLPTTNLWQQNPNLIPLDSTVFDPLVSYLNSI